MRQSLLVTLLAAGAWATPPTQPVLRAELLILRDTDQASRQALFGHDPAGEWGELVSRFDARNAARLREILDQQGWPTADQVGEDGAEAAWILALHLASDAPLMQRCLTLLESAVKRGVAPPEHLARLTDKVLLQQGKPQRYGSQLDFLPDGGTTPAAPIEAPELLESRRRALKLVPYPAYLKQRRQGYDELARAALRSKP
ncbi:MAG: hypothetical protein K1X89_00960 [Myxococcaceae bacterium]|nr:hypothetical protein [Myxococcaceae bacterium]